MSCISALLYHVLDPCTNFIEFFSTLKYYFELCWQRSSCNTRHAKSTSSLFVYLDALFRSGEWH